VVWQRVVAEEDRNAKKLMQRELQVARDVQQASWPSTLPEPPGYKLASFATPATAGGGRHLRRQAGPRRRAVGTHRPRHGHPLEDEVTVLLVRREAPQADGRRVAANGFSRVGQGSADPP